MQILASVSGHLLNLMASTVRGMYKNEHTSLKGVALTTLIQGRSLAKDVLAKSRYECAILKFDMDKVNRVEKNEFR